ncbi:MAG: hypothetical protein J5884_04355 [Paludibacteraceae bacterium]|nr:hypothetical protein [Paludibacteraceae bacterium]
MKRFLPFVFALASVLTLHAQTPTAGVLSALGYEMQTNVVLCVHFVDEATVCYPVYFKNSSDGWQTTFNGCPEFEELTNYPGWYVASIPYSDGIQGKPIQSIDTYGTFSWDYQPGDPAAWKNKGTNEATIVNGNTGESNVTFPYAGAYFYEISYWKEHKSPCSPLPKHYYTVKVYPPSSCQHVNMAITGNFNNWVQTEPMNSGTDSKGKYFSYEVYEEEDHRFHFYEAYDNDWYNLIEQYDSKTGLWSDAGDFRYPSTTDDFYTLTLDFSDDSQYRWKNCPPDYTPTGLSAVVNSDNTVTLSWDANSAVYYYTAEVRYVDGDWWNGWCSTQSASYYGITLENGRYSVTYSDVLGNGDYYFYVYAYNNLYTWQATSSQSFQISGLQNLGQSTCNILIPSDCCFDVSGDIWYYIYYGSDYQWVKAKKSSLGERWYTATFNVPAPYYTVSVLNQDSWESTGTDRSYAYSVNSNDAYFSLKKYSYNERWNMEDANSSMSDHNLFPTNASVSVDNTNATYTITIEYQQPAKYYYVKLYFSGTDQYLSQYIYPQENTTSVSTTYHSTFSTDTSFDKIIVQTNDQSDNRLCEDLTVNTSFTVPASALVPTGLNAVVNSDNTVTLYWDAKDGVKEYDVSVYYNGSTAQYWYLYPNDNLADPVNRKYSIVFNQPAGNGTYTFYVSTYDNNWNYAGDAHSTFEMSGFQPLGDVTLRVLIPPYSNMDVTNGIWFWWWYPGYSGQWIQATDKGGSWYEATVTATEASLQFLVHNTGDWNGSYTQSYNSRIITTSTACFELTSSKSLKDADCNAMVHDYTIQNVTVDNSNIGKLTFTIYANEYAPNYGIYYRLENSGDSYSWLGDGALDENHQKTVSVYAGQDCVYEYMIEVYDESWNTVATSYYGTVSVPANPYIINNMSATAAGGNVYELSWDANTAVDHFYVGYRDADDNWAGGTYYPSDLTIVNGKYTFLTKPFTVSGQAYWYIYSYDSNGVNRNYSSQYFDVVLTDLGMVTQRVQIPSDNNFDVSNGVWFWWKLPSEDDTQWKAVQAAKQTDRWFEASFDVAAASYNLFVANSNDLSSSTLQQTYTYSAAQSCYTMMYNTDPSNYAWRLRNADCNAADHDFRIKSVDVDNSKGGELTFTINAKDVAYTYEVYARVNGSSDYFNYYGGWYGSSGNQGSSTFSNATETQYEYRIDAYVYESGYGSYLIDTYTGVATVKANTNIPSELKATVASDGKTVSFSWKANKNSKADHYEVFAFDQSYGGYDRGALYNITGNSATMKLFINDTYDWYLEIYDADNYWLGEVKGPEFTISGTDYSPTDLQVTVSDQTATLTWKADKSVEKCSYFIYDNNGFSTGRIETTGKNGVYSATFTPPVGTYGDFNWSVYAGQNASSYYISTEVTGPSFTIDAPATTPTNTYSLNLGYYGNGDVSSGLSGEYPAGTQLSISAIPYMPWEFFGWSDGNKEATRTITLDQNIDLMAYFVYPSEQRTLTISAGEGGIVNTEVNGSYAYGTPVEIKATPNTGYEFEKWSDDDKNAMRSIYLYKDTIITASFKQKGADPGIETVYVNCGDNFTWSYESKDKAWLVAAENKTYRAQVGLKSTNLLSPTGTYSSDNGDFDMSYTFITYAGGSLVANVTKAEATVALEQGMIKATIKLTCDNNKLYVVSMEMEMPTAKYQRTVTALNLKREEKSGRYTFTAGDENYTVFISTSEANGTFIINDGSTYAEVAPAGTYDYTQIVSGSVTVTEDNGRLTLSGKMLSYSSIEFTLDLSNFTTVHVLRPTDNNFDLTDGMWIWSWPKNGNGALSKAEDQKNGWYEATIILTGEDFNFLAVNKDVSSSWSGSRQTADLNGVKTASSCYELAYNQEADNSQSQWVLYPIDCGTTNHNYAFTAKFDNSNVGRIGVTLTTDQVAPFYKYGYRAAGSTDPYTFSTIDAYGKKEFSLSFNNTTETEYELLLCGVKKDLDGKEFDVTALVETNVTVKANSNIPEELKAEVSKEQVTFSWKAKGTETSYYIVKAVKGGKTYYESAPVTGTTVTTSLYEDGTYDWTLAAYTVKGERLSEPAGPQFTILNTPDLRPTNLDVTVKGAKATLTWEAPAPVDECLLIIYEENPYMEVIKTLAPGNGTFTYNYTFGNYDKRTLKWSVSARISDHTYYESATVYGKSFKAEEGATPDPTPTTPQYSFAFDHTGLGTVTSDKPAGKYDENTVITLTAKPDQGWYLEKWSDGRTTLERTITLTKDTNIVAVFKSLQKYKVTIQAGSHGSVEPEITNKEYDGGAVIKIKAIPADDYKFVKWQEDGVTDAERTISITQDTVLTAKFAEIEYYRLEVEVVPAKGGNVLFNGVDVDLSKKYKEGTTVKLTAEPKSGYQFDHYEYGTEDIKTAEYSVVMNKNISITAYFKVKEEGLEQTANSQEPIAGKILRDGILYILRDGKTYSIDGQVVK